MTELLYESNLNAAIENIISNAETHILLLCPYFQLHDRFKDCLKQHINNHNLEIIVVFGKNEEDPSKSLNKADFEFLKSFPFVTIAHEKRLHAKYYANEKEGIVTSLNLHAYSLNNNIEVGVKFQTKNLITRLTDKALNHIPIISEGEDIATQGTEFFKKVLSNAEKIFRKEPVIESKLMGLQKKYFGSKILLDSSDDFFQKMNKTTEGKNNFDNKNNSYRNRDDHSSHWKSNDYTRQTSSYPNFHQTNSFQNKKTYSKPFYGFCIRTGDQIPFDISKPLSWPAYQTWSEFSNPDYREKFCHCCGRNWGTSVRTPLCNECA